MHTEEFVLIPKQMYTREQPYISQLLSNKDVHNPAKQLSLLQKTSHQQLPLSRNRIQSNKLTLQWMIEVQ